MDARLLASQLATGRVAMGAAMLLAPTLVARSWVGRRGADPGARLIMTAVGARDVGLGLGLARALRAGRDATPWLRAGTFADAVDLMATLRERDAIPTSGALTATATAAGSVVAGLYLERALARPTA
jgi:hypothetical protein